MICMKRVCRYCGIGITAIAFSWLPYFCLWAYWRSLISQYPEAVHGEISGPVLYFLPWLLVFAVFISAVTILVLMFLFFRPRR